MQQSNPLEFASFLEWCVEVVGERSSSARGHFRHSGITVEENSACHDGSVGGSGGD